MSLLKIYLPVELLNECKCRNRDYLLGFETVKSSERNIFQVIVKNYQEIPNKESCLKVSSLFIKSEYFNMKMVINKNKIEIINNENIFEKHLILLYEKNQFGLIDDKN